MKVASQSHAENFPKVLKKRVDYYDVFPRNILGSEGVVELLAKLQGREILRASDIQRLKQYIFEKYPGYETVDRAEVLARAVRDILNRELWAFDEMRRGSLRQAILTDAVRRNEFEIRASHVFLHAVWVEEQAMDADYSALTTWVNQQAITISPEGLRAIARELVQNEIRQFEDLSDWYGGMEQTQGERLVSREPVQALEREVVCFPAIREKLNDKKNRPLSKRHRSGNPLKQQGNVVVTALLQATPLLPEMDRSRRFQLPGGQARRAWLALPLLAFLVIPPGYDSAPELICQPPLTQIQETSRGGAVHASYFLPNRGASKHDITANAPANVPASAASLATITGEKDMAKLRQANDLPPELRYQEIDRERLLAFLDSRDSILVDEPYFNTILEITQQTDINPLLLFAITGQEQSFVPRTHANAARIANNPYNVFHSWRAYNTNIADTTWIACRTLIRLGQGCPEGVEPLRWINRSYAQDPTWHLGVTHFLQECQGAEIVEPRLTKVAFGDGS